MLEKIIVALAQALLNGTFSKQYVLWGIRYTDKSWSKIATGNHATLLMYEPKLFGEGWRTSIQPVGVDINMLPENQLNGV